MTRRVPRRVTGSFNQFLAKSNFVGRSPADEEKFERRLIVDIGWKKVEGGREDGSAVQRPRPTSFDFSRNATRLSSRISPVRGADTRIPSIVKATLLCCYVSSFVYFASFSERYDDLVVGARGLENSTGSFPYVVRSTYVARWHYFLFSAES